MSYHKNMIVPLMIGFFLSLCLPANAGEKDDFDTEVKRLEKEWNKPIPLNFSIDYTLISDYVWRGVNLSEYKGEGREKPNHQLNINIEYDTGVLGRFGGNFWFEWYAAQSKLTSPHMHPEAKRSLTAVARYNNVINSN